MSSPVNRQSPDSSNEVTSGAIRKRRQREREQLIKSTLQSQIQSFLAESPENAEIFWKRSGQKEQDALTRMGSKRTTSGFSQLDAVLLTIQTWEQKVLEDVVLVITMIQAKEQRLLAQQYPFRKAMLSSSTCCWLSLSPNNLVVTESSAATARFCSFEPLKGMVGSCLRAFVYWEDSVVLNKLEAAARKMAKNSARHIKGPRPTFQMRLLRIGTDGETGNRMTKYVRQTVTLEVSNSCVVMISFIPKPEDLLDMNVGEAFWENYRGPHTYMTMPSFSKEEVTQEDIAHNARNPMPIVLQSVINKHLTSGQMLLALIEYMAKSFQRTAVVFGIDPDTRELRHSISIAFKLNSTVKEAWHMIGHWRFGRKSMLRLKQGTLSSYSSLQNAVKLPGDDIIDVDWDHGFNELWMTDSDNEHQSSRGASALSAITCINLHKERGIQWDNMHIEPSKSSSPSMTNLYLQPWIEPNDDESAANVTSVHEFHDCAQSFLNFSSAPYDNFSKVFELSTAPRK